MLKPKSLKKRSDFRSVNNLVAVSANAEAEPTIVKLNPVVDRLLNNRAHKIVDAFVLDRVEGSWMLVLA